jgi:hypothetical protein
MLWAAEQVLRSGSCGALLFWQTQIRSDSLRRLHLAAQSAETLFFMMRPMAAAQDASPAPLRLGLRPKTGGIEIEFVKRCGPQRNGPLFLPMQVGPVHQAQPQTPHSAGCPVSQNAFQSFGGRSLMKCVVRHYASAYDDVFASPRRERRTVMRK